MRIGAWDDCDNPVSSAASMANLDILENEGLIENSAMMGTYMYEQLQTLYEHPIVGDVRGVSGFCRRWR